MASKVQEARKLQNKTLYDSGNSSPWGIWSDGTTIWVADHSDGKVYAYAVPSTNLPPTYSPTNQRYTWQGSTIVVSWDEVPDADYYKVYYDDFFSFSCQLLSGDPTFCEELAGNVNGTSYTHANPDDGANCYWVAACNDHGCSDIDSANPALLEGPAPTPDLVLDTPTVSTSTPNAGERFTLNATVRNQGNGTSSFTTLRYYQSGDSTITTADTAAGTDPVFRLDASASGDESITLTAPSTAGTYYYGACVDAESDEVITANNCSDAVTVTVGEAPAPDLVVDTPTVSNSTSEPGVRFTLSATVRNQGNGGSSFTTLRYYQSTDSTITTGDTEIGTDYLSLLDASESGDESISLTAPSTPGTYYYGACVDALSDELDTANNCSGAVAVTVGAAPAPDLVVDTPTVSAGAPVAGARFTLSATVRNQGNGNSSSTTLRYYRSNDSTISSSDTSVGTDSVSSLNAAGTSAQSMSLTAPSTPGTYYYGACVDSVSDEADTANNCSSAVAVTVAAAPTTGQTCTVNLIVAPGEDCIYPGTSQMFSVDANGTGRFLVFSSGSSISVRNSSINDVMYTLVAKKENDGNWLVQEVGSISAATEPGAPTGLTATANGQTQIDLSWTASSNDGGAAITRYKIEVSTNGSYWGGLTAYTGSSSTSCSHTGLTAESTRHYRGSAINSAGTSTASSIKSATTATKPVPDLVVDMPTVSDSTPATGGHFILGATVVNQGDGTADSTTLRYYQSTDSAITTTDTKVGFDYVSGLSASTNGDESIGLTAPSTPGTYYYGVCVESVSDEVNTGNNCSAAVTVTVRAGPAPDLVVGEPSLGSRSPAAGEPFLMSATVDNKGSARSPPPCAFITPPTQQFLQAIRW